MSKKAADLPPGSSRRTPFTTTRRGAPSQRRAAASTRLAREARQTRLAYLALFAVIALVIITLVAGGLWQYVISPAQPVATVNGVGIRTDTFQRYQKFQTYLLNNQLAQLQSQLTKLQSDTKHATANQPVIQALQQQLTQVQSNASNIQAYTLSQMENALELTQAAGKIKAAPTPAQLDAQMAALQKQAGGAAKFNTLLSSTSVTRDDVRTYLASTIVVQNNVTKHFAQGVSSTEPEAKARHILVKSKTVANQLAQSIRKGANFGVLAKAYSTDNGGVTIKAGVPLTGTAKLQYEQSSAANGGWLRDPSAPFVKNQPTWLTPQTSFVPEVLNAVLAMKPGEVRVVKSQYGYHVIQVTAHATKHLSKSEQASIRQQKGQTGWQNWETMATDPAKNKVNPANPYSQFPAATATG